MIDVGLIAPDLTLKIKKKQAKRLSSGECF